ncbi:hypothetical protein [Leekyejoonella antrihumi]|uniref:Uncharacterized protein n=1 Tax=Leekyejoonella antrihumi TaxID=1660198 RepID=A0A563DT16_9MICO|nr:hypothetical protein [Leekyejoonella antrihumi]TWP33133.1 hypothetical protein FGL98_22310 [Leekyejoonella antrihumi]
MPNISLDMTDATELREMLAFVSDWLASDREHLEPSLQRYVGVEGYGVQPLRRDIERFSFLLGDDGSDLFGTEPM